MAKYNVEELNNALEIVCEFVNKAPAITKTDKDRFFEIASVLDVQLAIGNMMENHTAKANDPSDIINLYDKLFP